jgi:16S rRNA (cytosine967-C5)-methyltransferase
VKLHRNLAEGVIEILTQIFVHQRYADKAIEQAFFNNKKWGARDRAFVAENVYDIVRWWRRICFAIQTDYQDTQQDLWRIFGAWQLLQNNELPEWANFQGLRRKQLLLTTPQTERKIVESIPDWLDDWGTAELGEKWDKEINALNTTANVVLRTNTLKIQRNALLERLTAEGVKAVAVKNSPDAVILLERKNVFATTAFKEGLFEVQDTSSQEVAPYLDVLPGMRIVDACAGAGGKTLHLAALTQNKGRIIALDTEEYKLKNLQLRAKRAGAQNIEIRKIESSKTIKRLYETADRLLLDVPCSGMGVLRRNPDAKWKLSPHFIQEVQATQAQILQEYSKILKKGGKMVYATCSIMPSENDKQVEKFIAEHSDEFSLLSQQTILPSFGNDGFFMAVIERNS